MYVILIAFAVGIFVGVEYLPTYPVAVYAVSVLLTTTVAATLSVHRHIRYRKASVWFLVLATMIAGALYGHLVHHRTIVSWPHGEAHYRGVVVSIPKPVTYGTRLDVYVRGRRVQMTIPAIDDTLRGETHLVENVRLGTPVEFDATIRTLGRVANPNRFQYYAYLRRHGYAGVGYARNLTDKGVDACADLPWYESLGVRMKRMATHVSDVIDGSSLDDAHKGVLKAMMVGIRSDLDDGLADVYRRAGASHLLALSGLHLGIVVGLLGFLFCIRVRYTRLRWLSAGIALAVVWTYALVAGVPNSLLRASLMMTMVIVGRCLMRNTSLGILVADAALVILLVSPMSLYDVGFQLSFAAVGAMALLLRPMQSLFASASEWSEGSLYDPSPSSPLRLRALCLRAGRWMWSLFCVSFVAWIGTLPLSVYYFHSLQPWSALLSMVLVPATSVVMMLALPWLVCLWTGWGSVASVLSWCVAHLLGWQMGLMRSASAWSGVYDDGLWLSPMAAVVLYVIFVVLCLVYRMPKRYLLHLIALLVALFVLLPLIDDAERRPRPHIVFYDNYRCPSAHIILSRDTSYLLPIRTDSVWVNMQGFAADSWTYYKLATPIRLDGFTPMPSSSSRRGPHSENGLTRVGGLTILQVHDGRWTSADTLACARPLAVDYLHVCHGYYGSLSAIRTRFTPRMVVLDSSLGWRRARLYREECDSLGWPSWDIRQQGALIRPLP